MATVRTVAAVLLTAALLVVTGCDSATPTSAADMGTVQTQDQYLDPGYPKKGKNGGGPPKGLFLVQELDAAIQVSGGFVDDLESGELGVLTPERLWNGLTLRLEGDPDRPIRVWAALVQDGEADNVFLSEATAASELFKPRGPGVFKPRGPGVFTDAGPLYPDPDSWIAGDTFVAGDALTGSPRLPPAAAFFRGNAWYPQPDNWHPHPDQWHPVPDNWIPNPDNWVVTGIIDGIYQEAGGPGAGKTAADADAPRLFLAVVPAGSAPDGQSPRGVGGILVQFEKP